MSDANILFSNTFDGTGYPTFDAWPYFDVLPGQSSLINPVVDGRNHGLATRTHALYSILRSTQYPGRANYKLDITAKWSNPGFSGDREIGLCARMKDGDNFVVARLRSMGTSSPELRLYKVIGGVATLLGTYTGSAISATKLAAGVQFRIRVEDLTDAAGNTSIAVYTGSSLSDNGDVRITWTGDLSVLRGNYTGGIEIGRLWKGSEILVSDFQCLDFADEWTATAPEPGQGWVVELDGTLYSTDDLAALDPPIELGWVQQEYGLAGNTCELRVKGKFHTGLLRVGQRVKVYHDGLAVFDGIFRNSIVSASPEEMQVFQGADAAALAMQVLVEEDDCSGTLHWNVYEVEADEYRSDRQNLTIGSIIKIFFDSYTDGVEKLRFYGAAPSSGAAYVQSELNLLDAVVPDIAVQGNFTEVILTLLSYMPKYQLWIDPADLKWHFKDVTNLTGDTVALTSEWATLSIEPDFARPYTAILWCGAKKESDDGVTLKLSDGSLTPAWTTAQEQLWKRDKANRSSVTLTILSAGTYAVGAGPTSASLVYVDVATGQIDEDDYRGGIATFSGDGFPRFVTTHTSTRISFSAPLWDGGTPPTPGSTVILSLVHPDAAWWLSMQGVGRGVYLHAPETICPGNALLAYKDLDLRNAGWCGEAWITSTGDDGSSSAQPYQYQVHVPTQAQVDAGFCSAVVMLAEKPKAPIGLSNQLPPPGGSPPVGDCTPGQPPVAASVDIQITISENKDCAPSFRLPPDEGTFEGTAFSEDETLWGTTGKPKATDWGNQRVFVVDDPDFVDSAIQEEGLKKAAQAWLDFHSQKFYAFSVTLSTPWFYEVPDFITSGIGPGGAVPAGLRPPGGATTTRWALNGGKKISLSSSKRTTGYEAASLPVFSVRWLVPENKTVLQAGSATAILKADAATLAKTLTNKSAAKRAAKMLKQLEEFRQRLLAKRADRVGGQQAGPIDGCDVKVTDQNTRTVRNVEVDDEQKKARQNYDSARKLLTDILFHGVETTHPGTQIGVPGLDTPEGKQVVPGAGPTLGSWADHRLAFQGPEPGPTNGARSKYGGLIGADDDEAYNPPDYLGKYGDLIFRTKENAAATAGGAIGIEWSLMDSTGAPTGGWSDLTKATDLPQQNTPWSAINAGSIDYQLREQTKEIARALGRVEDDLGRLLQPGNRPDSHPDGVPADLGTSLRTPGVANPYLHVVQDSFEDPGGLVYEGPMTEEGKNSSATGAGIYWRVAVPENVLVRVERVGAGAGMNGGQWDFANVNGEAMEYATTLTVEKKQLHAKDLADDQTQPFRSPPATANDPFCFYGQEGRVLSGTNATGAGGRIMLPLGARGAPLVTAFFEEDPDTIAPAGQDLVVKVAYAYKSSAWSSIGTTASGSGLTSDGSGQAVGKFLKPGGAVPPGLRKPTDFAVAVRTLPSPYAGNATLRGIDIDIARIEGGYWVRWRQRVGIGEVWTHNHPWYSDIGVITDTWALDFTKGWSEGLSCGDNWSIQLNEPLAYEELCNIAEAWVLTFTKNYADAMECTDTWVLVLNP